jgi:AraC-like DNA-binding protein
LAVASIADIFRQRLIELAETADPRRIILGGQEDVNEQEASRGSRYTHVADHFEIVVPIRGTTRIALEDRVVELGPGEIMLIERGVAHSEIASEPLEPYEVFWFHVRGSSALLTETRYEPPLTWTPVGPLQLPGRADLESLAAAIAAEISTEGWGWEGSVRGLLHYLCSIVVRRLDRRGAHRLRVMEPPAVQADQRTWNIVRTVLEYCEGNYRKGIGLREVAEALGYSPSYVSRLVTRHLGKSLSEQIQGRRMEEAKQLLEDPEKPVSVVAEELGYSDPAHFSRAFNRATGLSPKEYRRKLGGM